MAEDHATHAIVDFQFTAAATPQWHYGIGDLLKREGLRDLTNKEEKDYAYLHNGQFCLGSLPPIQLNLFCCTLMLRMVTGFPRIGDLHQFLCFVVSCHCASHLITPRFAVALTHHIDEKGAEYAQCNEGDNLDEDETEPRVDIVISGFSKGC